jgi:hypothetical protein
MQDAATSLLVSYLTTPIGIDGDGDVSLNDLPLPTRTSESYPSVAGLKWVAGSVITLIFSQLSPADTVRLLAANNTTGTLTVWSSITWIRCSGSCVYNASTKTFTFTLTKDVILNPYLVPDPLMFS